MVIKFIKNLIILEIEYKFPLKVNPNENVNNENSIA